MAIRVGVLFYRKGNKIKRRSPNVFSFFNEIILKSLESNSNKRRMFKVDGLFG